MNEIQTTKRILNELPTRGLKPGYRNDLAVFNKWVNGRAVDQFLIKDYFEYMKSENRSPKTMGRHKCALKAALLSSCLATD